MANTPNITNAAREAGQPNIRFCETHSWQSAFGPDCTCPYCAHPVEMAAANKEDAQRESARAGAATQAQPRLPIWQVRENMGASPIAIKYAELVKEDLRDLPPEMHGMAIAALIDSAIRHIGAPSMFRIVRMIDVWGKKGADSISLGALMDDDSEEDREETLEFVAHAGLHRATHLASLTP